jgi:hypothetical protein
LLELSEVEKENVSQQINGLITVTKPQGTVPIRSVTLKLNMVVQACNSSTGKTEAEDDPKLEASLGSISSSKTTSKSK